MPSVQLMLTCLCDAFYGEVGIATVKVLEHCGCEVIFPADQTCCGQPAFNSGSWEDARRVAKHCVRAFDPKLPIVTPSSSCAAMMTHGYGQLFSNQDQIQPRVFELSQYLAGELSVSTWIGQVSQPTKVAYHSACHGRVLGLSGEQLSLISSIKGVEVLLPADAEQCCGFGGAFSVTQGHLSSAIGLEKLRRVAETGATEILSGDMGCLIHLKGLIAKHSYPLTARHYVQLLAETIQ